MKAVGTIIFQIIPAVLALTTYHRAVRTNPRLPLLRLHTLRLAPLAASASCDSQRYTTSSQYLP